jgi:hypothetical protein
MTMKHYARLADGLVVETKDLPAEFDLEALFGAGHGWIEAPAEVAEGWRHDGETFTAPSAPKPDPTSVLIGLKDEAGRLIHGVISATGQANLSLAMALIAATAEADRTKAEREMVKTAREGRAWIDAVRARVADLARNAGATPEGEERWPQPSKAVVALAKQF